MVASFLAAFMSTMSTQLNWGTSYVVHDLYEAFINPKASKKNVIMVSRICMVGFTLLAAVVASKLTTILSAYTFLMQFWAGMGLILIVRWYWWRITAGAEFICLLFIVVMILLLNLHTSSAEGAPLLAQGFYDWIQNSLLGLHDLNAEDANWVRWAVRMFVFTFTPALVWVPYALIRSKTPNESAIGFYKKIKISSFGWKKVEQLTGIKAPKGEFMMNMLGWAVTAIALYGVLLGTGCILFHQWLKAAAFMPIGILFSWFTWKIMTGNILTGDNNE
jgi:hypothetical protein